jgi:hypothetical protein
MSISQTTTDDYNLSQTMLLKEAQFTIIKVRFYEFTEFMASIGGIYSFLSAIFLIMISYFSNIEFEHSLVGEIIGN